MASVEIYIKNYKGPDGTVISRETLLQTIPMTGDPVITNPKVKTDLGKAGSFEFGLELNSPYYDAMMQMKTIMRVVYFGETLFRGRVLTIDKGMARSRVVHCEGDLAFLLDSHQVGVKDDARQKTDVLTYLSSVINQHNSDVDDSDKRFILGEAPSSYSDSVLIDQRVDVPADKAEQKFGSSSYDTSMDRLEGLLSDFGGYMRTRYDPSDGTVFLDWLDNYYHPYSGQDIEVASNLIDLSGQTEVSNLFTIVLPIGKKDNGEVFINSWWPKVSPNHPKVDYIKVSELATIPLYSDEVLNSGYHRKEDYANANARFGKIWKPVEFENADTPQKLFNYAKDWIKNNFMPELTQWDVTALDLKFVGVDTRALFTGDRVKLVHPEVDQTFISVTIISAEYDLYNPDKNKFKIGIPNQQINASYGVKQKNSSGAKSVNAGISTDNLQKELESKVNSLLDDLNRDRDILQQQYILKTKFGEDIGLDSPLAFLKYETDCVTERDPETVAKETADVVNKMNYTMMISKDNLVMQALDRTASEFRFNDPIKWNDPQLVIDNTPELKQRQLTFKAQATAHLTQDLGLPDDQALVLLNESIYDTNLAGLVDDDGNWTQEAIDQGALNWNPELKEIIKKAKLAFDESQGKSVAGGIITSAVPFLTGGSLDIANVLHAVELKDPTTGFTDQVVDLLNGGISGKLTELAEKTGLSFDFSNILNTSEITDKVTGLTDKVIGFLDGGISGKLTELLNGTGFNFDIGNLFNTEQISNTVTGIVNKTVGLVGGLINTEEVKNTVTGIANKAVNFIGGLFSGTSKEKDGSTDVDKGINFLSGLITGSDKQTSATGSKEKALDIINGLLSGSSKEKTGSTDVDKSVDILSGLLTGSDKQTESTGTGSKVFNFLSGVLTGSETGKESTGESNKLVDVLSGLFSGSKTKASSSAEEKTTFFLGNDKAQVDGTTGTASFGDGYEWMVTLNDTVGKERGFISAKDFQAVQSIPSFKTKFAAVDTFVANQATFNDTYTKKLTAAEAYINKINSTSVDADAYVSAGHGSFNSVNVKNGLTANTVTGNSMKIKVAGPNNTSEDADLSLCFSSAVSSFKDGVWTLTLYKIGGGSQDVPFDLTATDWYKNQIAGKYNDGWDAAVDASNIPEIISSSTEKGTMSASWPNKKTIGSNVTRGTTEMTFRLEVNQNDAFIRVEGDNDTYKDYAHITHNQYKNGQNATKVKKGTWDGTSITFTTDAPTPNANADQKLTLSWNNDATWSWDDDNGYQQKYQIKDVTTVIDTVYATIPGMAVGLTEPGTQKSSWWKTSGTNANKYVVPGTSAAAYLATDTAKDHPLSSLKTGSDIVITPTEAINAGFKKAHDSITLSQTGSSVVRPGSSTTIYPKALSDAADTSPDNITTISAILTAPTATKTDKVTLESTDISNNVSKTGVIVHYSDNSTTNGLQVLIDASAVYSAGIAKGEGQGSSAGYKEGYTTGQSNVNAEITKIAYRSKSASYNSGTLELGADATGRMTKIPQEGDPTVTALNKYDILTVPVTTTPAVLKIGSWSSSTNKISITKNSGGTANVDGEAIAVGVTGAEITVTPGTNTIGTPGHQGNGIYSLSATGTVDINGTTAYLSGSDSFTATGAINYGKSRVGLYKTYNWTGAAGVTINGQSGQYKYHYYIRTSGRTDVNGNTSEDGDYLNPSSAINHGKTLVTVDMPFCGETTPAVGDNNVRASIRINASASNGNTNFRNYSLGHGTYNNGERCVNLVEAGVVIGRISTNSVYVAGQQSVSPTSATISNSTANASTGKRYATLTVKYKGPDTSEQTKSLENVEVTSIYNDGKSSGSSKTTHSVNFKVTFDDGHTGNVVANCANIWNQGVAASEPAVTYVYVYASGNDNAVNMRKSPSGSTGNLLGRLKCNTKVVYLSYSNGYAKISYDGYTGYVSCSGGLDHNYVWTEPKYENPVTSGWAQAPDEGGSGGDDPVPSGKTFSHYEAVAVVHHTNFYSGTLTVNVQMSDKPRVVAITSNPVQASSWSNYYSQSTQNPSAIGNVYHSKSMYTNNLGVIVLYRVWYTDNSTGASTYEAKYGYVTSTAL